MVTRLPVFDPNKSPVLIQARDDIFGRNAALRRQRDAIGTILGDDDTRVTEPGALEAVTQPGALSSETALDKTNATGVFATVQHAIAEMRQQEISIMAELDAIKRESADTIPGLFDENLTPETREEVIGNIKRQEANWHNLKPAQITVPNAEKAMWSSFMKTARDNDFMNRKSVESLERGEILDLTVVGFEQFQILKIRKKDMQKCAMCVVEFIVKAPIGEQSSKKARAHYFISLPLVEGGKLTFINQNTERPYPMSYKIEAMSINRKHHFSIKQFLDMLIKK